MKRGLKILIGIVVAVVVIVGVAMWLLFSNLNDIVKAAIEEFGSEATQTDVAVDTVDISLTSGEGSIGGLLVGNPSGFNTDSAISIGGVEVAVDTDSVTGDTIVIKELSIDAPVVTYEIDTAGGSNVDAIKRNIEAATGGSGGSTTSSGESEKKVVIENLYIRNGRVQVSSTMLQGQSMGANIPTIHRQNIGKDSGGAAPEAIAGDLVAVILNGATRAAAAIELPAGLGDLEKTLDDAAGGIGGMVGGGAKDLGGAAGEGAESVEDAVKGLIGGDK